MNIERVKKYEPIEGKWRVTKELGSGAFGTVFEIERIDFPDVKAALKVITIPQSKAELDSFRQENFDMDEKSITSYYYGYVENFQNEIKMMLPLAGNSNIASYMNDEIIPHEGDVGWDILIRMELLTPINNYYKEHPPTEKDIIKLGIDICRALEVCGKYNIIHRDIKPSNIFISDVGDYKLGDFGVARTMEKTTGVLSKKGTVTYMSPEVYKGESYGSTVDIYSLGIVLYRLMNNNLEPFRTDRTFADAENANFKRMNGEKMPAPANAGEELSRIILKACAYNSADRYQSPKDMRKDLEKIKDGTVDEVSTINTSSITDNDRTVGVFDERTAKEANIEDKTEGTVGIFEVQKNDEEKKNDSALKSGAEKKDNKSVLESKRTHINNLEFMATITELVISFVLLVVLFNGYHIIEIVQNLGSMLADSYARLTTLSAFVTVSGLLAAIALSVVSIIKYQKNTKHNNLNKFKMVCMTVGFITFICHKWIGMACVNPFSNDITNSIAQIKKYPWKMFIILLCFWIFQIIIDVVSHKKTTRNYNNRTINRLGIISVVSAALAFLSLLIPRFNLTNLLGVSWQINSMYTLFGQDLTAYFVIAITAIIALMGSIDVVKAVYGNTKKLSRISFGLGIIIIALIPCLIINFSVNDQWIEGCHLGFELILVAVFTLISLAADVYKLIITKKEK